MSIHGLGSAFGDGLENGHRLVGTLLTLQPARIRIKLDWCPRFHGVVSDFPGFVGSVHGLQQVSLGAEILEAFLILNRQVSPLQSVFQIDLVSETKIGGFSWLVPIILGPPAQLVLDRSDYGGI